MSTPRPLGLSDEQLRLVLDGAQRVPNGWRSRFLEAVADVLLPLDPLTDADVSQAVASVIARIIPGAAA